MSLAERQPHDQAFLRVNQMPEVHRVADETLKRFRDGLLRRRIDQKARDQLAEFVTGRAVDRPIFPQRFVARQNFLDQEVDRAPILRRAEAQAPPRNGAAVFRNTPSADRVRQDDRPARP